ncbi:MAG: M23 family metallopeptidase, partial [Candidatus Nanopelagicales bacterium]|nr:M23 family metallopeptidase [Candidatus Nanopelagicales bacterium]
MSSHGAIRGRSRAGWSAALVALAMLIFGGTGPAGAAPKPGGTGAGAPASGSVATAARVMPLPKGSYRLSATFGQAGPMWSSGYHTGQDFSASQGTPVLAAADGVVVFAGSGGRYGSLIEIAHSDGVQTWYAHLSEIRVRVGSRVVAGSNVGAVGSTGNSTGPHLHFEVRLAGQAVDPMPWLGGATLVVNSDVVASPSDPTRAADLRAQLVEAEAIRVQAEARAAEHRAQAAVVGQQAEEARVAADAARRDLLTYAREVYKVGGMDPEWLLQAEAWSAGDAADFTDRQVFLDYSHGSQNQRLVNAAEKMRQAHALSEENSRLLAEADA